MHPSAGRSAKSTLALLVISFLAAQALWAKKPVPACTPLVPCTDPRGCPDLQLEPGALTTAIIEFKTFAPTDCAVVEGMVAAGPRKLLRFATETHNIGPGALFLGDPADHPDWFVYSACHGHYHIKDYADYRLWTVSGYQRWKALRDAAPTVCAEQVFDANPDLAGEVVKGNKLGLCFEDVLMMGQAYYATEFCPTNFDPRTYVSCSDAGLSVCWADTYGEVDGQWIDVTDLPDGDYVLENESNAKRLITETDYTNNSAAALIHLQNRNVTYRQPM